jgi:hypothetical protein
VHNWREIETCQTAKHNAFAIAVAGGALEAAHRLANATETLEALAQCAPHARIVRSQRGGATIIVQCVERHLENLVGLAEAVPGAIVALIGVERLAVGLNGSLGVLQLHVLVSEQRPRRDVARIEPQRALEVGDRLDVLALDAVVVADDDARFRSIAIDARRLVRQHRQLGGLVLHVENVGVPVELVEAVRLGFAHLLEQLCCGLELAQVVQRRRVLTLEPGRARKVNGNHATETQTGDVALQRQRGTHTEKRTHPVQRQREVAEHETGRERVGALRQRRVGRSRVVVGEQHRKLAPSTPKQRHRGHCGTEGDARGGVQTGLAERNGEHVETAAVELRGDRHRTKRANDRVQLVVENGERRLGHVVHALLLVLLAEQEARVETKIERLERATRSECRVDTCKLFAIEIDFGEMQRSALGALQLALTLHIDRRGGWQRQTKANFIRISHRSGIETSALDGRRRRRRGSEPSLMRRFDWRQIGRKTRRGRRH